MKKYPKQSFRFKDETVAAFRAIKKARPSMFPTDDAVLRELVSFYLERHQNLADNVKRILEGLPPVPEILIYRVSRKARRPGGPEEPRSP